MHENQWDSATSAEPCRQESWPCQILYRSARWLRDLLGQHARVLGGLLFAHIICGPMIPLGYVLGRPNCSATQVHCWACINSVRECTNEATEGISHGVSWPSGVISQGVSWQTWELQAIVYVPRGPCLHMPKPNHGLWLVQTTAWSGCVLMNPDGLWAYAWLLTGFGHGSKVPDPTNLTNFQQIIKLKDVKAIFLLYGLWRQKPILFLLHHKELTSFSIHLGENNSSTARALYPYVSGDIQYPQLHHFGTNSVGER